MNADGYHIIESVMLSLLQLNNYMSNNSFKKIIIGQIYA